MKQGKLSLYNYLHLKQIHLRHMCLFVTAFPSSIYSNVMTADIRCVDISFLSNMTMFCLFLLLYVY